MVGNRNLFSGKKGLAKAAPCPSSERFKSGDGRVGEVKHEVDFKGGTVGRKGASTASALDAEIPAFLRKESLEALGAQLDFEKDVLSSMRHGVMAPLRVNEMGHYISSVVEFGKGRPRSDRRPNLAASYFEWRSSEKRPD